MSKSTLFIGSSSESLKVAYAMQANLEGDFEVTVWNQGVFTLSHTVIEDLINNLSKFQFAVFIFSPDDVLHMREVEYVAVRDNVIFEMGLFMGRIGRDRTFFVLPSGTDKLRMPSDILGVSYAGYNPNRSDGN